MFSKQRERDRERQTNRQTDRQTDRQTETETETEKESGGRGAGGNLLATAELDDTANLTEAAIALKTQTKQIFIIFKF